MLIVYAHQIKEYLNTWNSWGKKIDLRINVSEQSYNFHKVFKNPKIKKNKNSKKSKEESIYVGRTRDKWNKKSKQPGGIRKFWK